MTQKLQEPDPSFDMQYLERKALAWKQKQIIFGPQAVLTDEDKLKLKELACYPEYYRYVKLNNFFTWVFRHQQSVDLFVQCPQVPKKFHDSLLAARVGTWGGLKLTDGDVTLRMDDRDVSVLNPEDQITFSTGYVTTIGEIFASYREKNIKEGIYTYFKDKGVMPYDSFAQGYVDHTGKATPIDLSDKVNWYRQLPMLEKLTLEQAKKRFADREALPDQIDGKNWILTQACTNQTEKMDTFGSHCFLRLAIPNSDSSYDYTYGWGKFAKEYPQNCLHALTFPLCPKEGGIQYVDNNEIYDHRRKLERHIIMNPTDGALCLQSLRKDIKQARKGDLVFQILGDNNCSGWAHHKIETYGKVKSNMDINFFDLEPSGFLGTLLKVLKHAPLWFSQIVLDIVGFCLGSWVGMTDSKGNTFRVISNTPWSDHLVDHFHHPGNLFKTTSTP